jgi:chemotaxis signal transduction protein
MKQGLDWAAAKKRLAQTQAALDHTALRSSEDLNRIYNARAEALAHAARSSDALEAGRILLFGIGAARFGVPLESVAEAIGNPKIAPVPGAPKAVAGLIQLRGEVRPVWNIGQILGLTSPEKEQPENSRVILLRNGTHEFGILVDQIEDVVARAGDHRQTTIGSVAATITKDFVSVLDSKSLFEKLQDSTPL